MPMLFIESTAFQREREKLLDEEAFRALQNEIIAQPEKGKLIRGSGGLRKVRFGLKGRGKSGGVRVIYYLVVSARTVYLLDLYAKSEQATLALEAVRIVRKRLEE